MRIEIDEEISLVSKEVEESLKEEFLQIDRIRSANFAKVLEAFRASDISDFHFRDTSGYGYHDPGREKVESVFSEIFRSEASLVRPQIISGTHAISIVLFGLLRPGNRLLYLTGEPYETGMGIIGRDGVHGSLREFGIGFAFFDIREGITEGAIKEAQVAVFQRSQGYSFGRSYSIGEIGQFIKIVKSINPEICVVVDNCYGEFVEELEPFEAGADVVVGSLIKNMGGAIAPGGGYITGKEKYLKKIESMLTAPGVGKEIGPMFSFTRAFLQGVFFAPLVVSNALKGAVFAAGLFERLGYEVRPESREKRTDIVQGIKLGTPEKLRAFANAVQYVSPIDWNAEVEPSPLAGYENEILMAAGTFVQGSSIELSCDAPMKEPYAVYLQGGIYYEHSKLASMYAATVLKRNY